MGFCFPENVKIVHGYIGATNGLGTNADIVSMKNCHRAWVVVTHSGANGTLTVEINECDDVTPSANADVTATMPIWLNSDYTASDALARQTDAATQALTGSQQAVIQVDPAMLSSGYDCFRLKGNTGHASDTCCVTYILEPRYKADPPPTAITN